MRIAALMVPLIGRATVQPWERERLAQAQSQ
jgi:hypothetical protein